MWHRTGHRLLLAAVWYAAIVAHQSAGATRGVAPLASDGISSTSVSQGSYSGAADDNTAPILTYRATTSSSRLVGSRKLLRVWRPEAALSSAAAVTEAAADTAPDSTPAGDSYPDADIIVPEISPAASWDVKPLTTGLGGYGGANMHEYGSSPRGLLQQSSSFVPGAYYDFRSDTTYGSYGEYGSYEPLLSYAMGNSINTPTNALGAAAPWQVDHTQNAELLSHTTVAQQSSAAVSSSKRPSGQTFFTTLSGLVKKMRMADNAAA